MRSLLDSPVYLFALGLICGIVGFRFGWRAGGRALLPVLQGLFGFLAFASAWRHSGPLLGALAVVGWALGTTGTAIAMFRAHPQWVDSHILRARPYRQEMLAWLSSGRGPESRPLATVRAHVIELALYLLAAVATANLLSLMMGALLLNYMNAYVAHLLDRARNRLVVALLAWNIWSILRVGAYILLGCAAAAPAAAWLGYPFAASDIRWLAWVGGGGVVLDLLLKLLFSRPCGRALAAALDLDEAAP